jgi:hypothetical protein
MQTATKIISVCNYVNQIDTHLPGSHPVIGVINPGGGNKIEGLIPVSGGLKMFYFWRFQIA